MDWSPKAIDAPRQMPDSSASPDERAIVVWVSDQCLIGCCPLMAMPPDVDRRVVWHPPKSVST